MDANDIVMAYSQQNAKKSMRARAHGRYVHFSTTNGMVSLVYNTDDGKFTVRFTKFIGAWGDYIKAIARSLFTVLNTLKSAGLPFDAPPSLAGMVIEATTADDNTVYVRWQGERVLGGQVPTHTCQIVEGHCIHCGAEWLPAAALPDV